MINKYHECWAQLLTHAYEAERSVEPSRPRPRLRRRALGCVWGNRDGPSLTAGGAAV